MTEKEKRKALMAGLEIWADTAACESGISAQPVNGNEKWLWRSCGAEIVNQMASIDNVAACHNQ